MNRTKKHSPKSKPRVTIFTIPRAFTGGHKISQENTLGSWMRLSPRPEILLFCNDPGVAEAAEQFDCVHVPDIRCNDNGIPYISHAFYLASQLATNDILCYANADIIFIQDFITAIDVVVRGLDQPFLIVGQRWDISLPKPLRFVARWQQQLRKRARHHGNLHPASAIDYFIYSRGAIVALPDFLVGSPRWDNWTVADAESRGIQVVSATKAITCIHQRHKHLWPAEGIRYNRRLCQKSGGGIGYAYSGSWILNAGAELRRKGKKKVGVSRTAARPKSKRRTKRKHSRPTRVVPKDELGLPVNLNVPACELVSVADAVSAPSAKRLRRQQTREKTPVRKKHSHSVPERETLLAERAKLQRAREKIQAARIRARDTKLRRRRKKDVASTIPRTAPEKHKHKRENPKDNLGLPINLNVPVQSLMGPAKRLRRTGSGKVSPQKKHKHMVLREALLARQARLQEAQKAILRARVEARDARLLKRRREKS